MTPRRDIGPSSRRLAPRTLAGRLTIALASLVVAAVAVAQTPEPGPRLQATASGATGAVAIANSHEGSAIVSASALAPGGATTGTVAIRNSGDTAGNFRLAASKLTDVPGLGGGVLSDRLTMRVEELSPTPATLYEGGLRGLTALALPRPFAAGESRTYRFTLTFAATAGNAYQQASSSVHFDWGAEPVPSPAGTPQPAPPAPTNPAPPAGNPRAPTPNPAPAADTKAPEVKLGALAQRLSPSRTFRVAVSCNEACRVSVAPKLSGTRVLERIRLARLSKTFRKAGREEVVIRLSKRAASALRAARRARKRPMLVLAVAAEDTEGNVRRMTARTVIQTSVVR